MLGIRYIPLSHTYDYKGDIYYDISCFDNQKCQDIFYFKGRSIKDDYVWHLES